MSLEASQHLKLEPWEVFAIVEGFDEDPENSNNTEFIEAYEFGKAVAKALRTD